MRKAGGREAASMLYNTARVGATNSPLPLSSVLCLFKLYRAFRSKRMRKVPGYYYTRQKEGRKELSRMGEKALPSAGSITAKLFSLLSFFRWRSGNGRDLKHGKN